MPKFIFNTSSNGDLKIGEGLALFANNKNAVNWGIEYTKVLVDYFDEGWWHENRFYLRFSTYAGFLMGYAVNSIVNADIEYDANNVPTKGTFSFGGTKQGKDGFAAGIKAGIGASLGFNFYVDIPVIPTVSVEGSVNLDLLGFLLSLAFDQFGSGASKGRAGGDGGLNLFDESLGGLSGKGSSQGFIGITLKLNLLNFITGFAGFNKTLKKCWSSVAAGVLVRVGTNITFQPTSFWYQKHAFYFPASMSDTVVVQGKDIVLASGGSTAPTTLYVQHNFSFTVHLGVYLDITIVKFVSIGVELTYDILGWLNLKVGGFRNRIRSGGTIASAPSGQKPRVVFHKS